MKTKTVLIIDDLYDDLVAPDRLPRAVSAVSLLGPLRVEVRSNPIEGPSEPAIEVLLAFARDAEQARV